MLGRIAWRTCLVLALCISAAIAAPPPPTSDFVLTSRTPGWDFYGYFGTFWQDVLGRSTDTLVLPLEFRAVNPKDWQFIVDTSVGAPEARLSDLETGDTFFRIVKGFRPKTGCIDYWSLELGAVAKGADALTSNASWTTQFRFQGGPTRLGFDVSLGALGLEKNNGRDYAAFTSAVGVRSQVGRLHLGLDFNYVDLDDKTLRSIDLVVMQRNYQGNSFYGLIQKGLSETNDFWYVGFGYDFKLGF